MVPVVSADDARRRSDEAVRRLRDESARRVEERGRVRAFSSWCALATLAAGISLAALDAHDARLQEREQEARQAVAERETRIANACAERSAHLTAMWQDMTQKLARAKTEEERARIRAEAAERKAQTIRAAAGKGCGPSLSTQPAWIPERLVAPSKVHRDRIYPRFACGGDPPNAGL